jgi:hypothetical protein
MTRGCLSQAGLQPMLDGGSAHGLDLVGFRRKRLIAENGMGLWVCEGSWEERKGGGGLRLGRVLNFNLGLFERGRSWVKGGREEVYRFQHIDRVGGAWAILFGCP